MFLSFKCKETATSNILATFKGAHLRYLERLALILSTREAESPGFRVVLPVKQKLIVDPKLKYLNLLEVNLFR